MNELVFFFLVIAMSNELIYVYVQGFKLPYLYICYCYHNIYKGSTALVTFFCNIF